MPLLSLADFDKSLKLNQLLYNQLNPLLNNNLLNAQLNLLTAEQLLNNTSTNTHTKQTSYSRYKTELCRQFSENGQCKYGDKCQFAHGIDELKDVKRHPKYKTDFCKTFHSKGFCPYGPRCHFIHEFNESLDLTSGLSSVSRKKQDSSIDNLQSQFANSLLLNIKNELDSGSESNKFDCHEERNMFAHKENNIYGIDESSIKASVSLNASPSSSSSSSSNSSLNDLFVRQTILSPKMADTPPSRTRSSVSSTSSCFSTSSSLSPFDLYPQNNKLVNLIGFVNSQSQSKANFNQKIIW